MRSRFYIFALVILLNGCVALKPSADLQNFSSLFVKDEHAAPIANGQVKVTFFGTSTLLFDDGETQLLIDGFLSRPPLGKVAFGKMRSNEKVIKAAIDSHYINRLQAVFVCHSHYDHVLDAPTVCKLTGAGLYGSSSTLMVGKGAGLPEQQMHLYNAGTEIPFGKFSVIILNSKHTPPFKVMGKTNATDPNHPNITEPVEQPAKEHDYIEGGTYDIYIKHGSHTILVKASTNFIEGALNNYPVDVLFLGSAMLGKMPIDFQESYYTQTVKATAAKTVVPIHWDSFMKPLSKPLQPLPNAVDDVDAGFKFLMRKTQQDGVALKLMQVQQSTLLF